MIFQVRPVKKKKKKKVLFFLFTDEFVIYLQWCHYVPIIKFVKSIYFICYVLCSSKQGLTLSSVILMIYCNQLSVIFASCD